MEGLTATVTKNVKLSNT